VVCCGPRAAAGGEALVALAGPASEVPVATAPHTQLPGHVGGGCLVVVVALGEGEAALLEPAAAEAVDRGASVLLAGAGGQVAPAGHGGWEGLRPPGPVAPVALAPLVEVLPALLAVAAWAGVLPDGPTALAEARAGLDTAAAGWAGGPGTVAHEGLARRIGRGIPLFEGAAGVGAAAARSWRRSWNLLAKAPAIAAAEPGAAFAEVAGFGQLGDVTRQLLVLVSLRTAADAGEDRVRSDLLAELAGEALAGWVEVEAAPDRPAGALAHLLWLGAATAYARARQEGLDPGPVPAPAEVEARLWATRRPSHRLA
jgi:hypothetical protein